MENNQAYRASVGLLLVKKDGEDYSFLLTHQVIARPDEYDFLKGGVLEGEGLEEAITREVNEEIGSEVVYEIVSRSNWNVIYDWSESYAKEKGFRGQARVSYWAVYQSGVIEINDDELDEFIWVKESELTDVLINSGFPEYYVKSLDLEWQTVKEKLSIV